MRPKNDERVLDDLMRGLLDLRRRNLHQEIEYRQYLIQETQEQGDLKASQHGKVMVQLIEVKKNLDRATGNYVGHSEKKSGRS